LPPKCRVRHTRIAPRTVGRFGPGVSSGAAGVQAARRHPGDVAARRRCWIRSATVRDPPAGTVPTIWMRRPPPGAHPPPHAGGRGDGRRAPGLAVGIKMRQERTARGSPPLLGRVASGGPAWQRASLQFARLAGQMMWTDFTGVISHNVWGQLPSAGNPTEPPDSAKKNT
jgi:hypothetical protein